MKAIRYGTSTRKFGFIILIGGLLCLFGNLSFASFQENGLSKMESLWEGHIQSKKGVQLIVYTESRVALEVGIVGSLDKHFEKNIFGGIVEGWIQIAKVRVEKVESHKVTFTILEELSGGTINDEPIDHFKAGKRVKFLPEMEDK